MPFLVETCDFPQEPWKLQTAARMFNMQTHHIRASLLSDTVTLTRQVRSSDQCDSRLFDLKKIQST